MKRPENEEKSRPLKCGSRLLLTKRFQVLPELRLLFHQLLFRHGELVPQQKILKGIFVQNIFHVKSFSFYLEIETMFAGAKAEKLLTRPLEMAQGLMGLRQISRLDCPQRLDDRQLSERVELVELVHGLFGKGDLKHGGKTGAHRRRAFR